MKFDQPATKNVIDQLNVVGKPVDRIDGPLKTTGAAPYAYDRHDVVANQAYGCIVAAGIAKGRIASMNLAAARAAPGVIAIVTAANAGKLGKGNFNTAIAARRPAGRALSPSDRPRRCRFLRAGARGRATRARRLRPCEGQLRPRRREGVRQARRQFRHAGRDEGRRLRRAPSSRRRSSSTRATRRRTSRTR